MRERFESEQVTFFARLVETPSHTYARDDVEAAAQLIDAHMQGIGFTCVRVPDPEGRFADHRVYSPADLHPDAPAALCVGHIDTVFPRDTGFLTFERDDNVVRGPGVLDMKSGLTTVVFALEALAKVAPEHLAALPLRFVLNSEEEVGSPSSRELLARLAPQSSCALVFEGGRAEDKIITRRKGGGMFKFKVTGKAAHAGNHHAEGRNAIAALAHLIPHIEALTDYARGVTVNVGLVSGGTAKNTVPEFAECVVDTRFERVADADALVAQLHALADDPWAQATAMPEALRECTVELSGGVTRPPMEASEGAQRLRLAYEPHAAAAGLQTGEAPLQGGGSDANLLAAWGVPSIDGLGPFGKHFHRTDEFSHLDSLRMRTEALAAFLLESLPTLHDELWAARESSKP